MTADAQREHARRVLAVHTNRAGRCGGCLDSWSRVAGFPCDHARYARLMLADIPVDGSVLLKYAETAGIDKEESGDE